MEALELEGEQKKGKRAPTPKHMIRLDLRNMGHRALQSEQQHGGYYKSNHGLPTNLHAIHYAHAYAPPTHSLNSDAL